MTMKIKEKILPKYLSFDMSQGEYTAFDIFNAIWGVSLEAQMFQTGELKILFASRRKKKEIQIDLLPFPRPFIPAI